MISHYGIHSRGQIRALQDLLLKKNTVQSSKFDPLLSTESLGKNFSGYIFEKDSKKLLVLIDTDDGSGGTPSDCKIVWPKFGEAVLKYRPDDYIIFKQNVSLDPECNQFYPFKEDVYPIGVFSSSIDKVLRMREKFQGIEKDIDVFYAGGLSTVHKPWVWPKNRDPKMHWSSAGARGYMKLKEIKDRRKDLNIQAFDGDIPQEKFFEMIMRSKICMDFPVIGKTGIKFHEFLLLGSCVLSLTQQLTPWPCEENVHYFSLGDDYDFATMEEKIDFLLAHPEKRKEITSSVLSIRDDLYLESILHKMQSIIDKKFNSMSGCNISYWYDEVIPGLPPR